MEKSTLIKSTLMVTVAIILIAGCLMPVLDVKSDSDTIDVFIIDGQSNAEYESVAGSVDINMVNAQLGKPDNALYYYGNSTNPTSPRDADKDYGIHSIYSDGAYRVGGLVAPFAYYLSEKQDRDILIIDVGVGGASISHLVPGAGWGDWKISIIQSALADLSYDHVNMIGWCWLQGEADTTMPVDTYINYFDQLENYYQSIGADNCYIVKLRAAIGGNATIAQNQIIESNPYVHLGTDITETFAGTSYLLDSLHYSQSARILIAEKVTEVIPAETFGEWGNMDYLLAAIPAILIIAIIIALVRVFLKSRAEK